MSRHVLVRATALLLASLVASPGSAQSTEPQVQQVQLTISAGRALRIALDRRIRVSSVGQQVTGTLVEPVYAYDRLVLPAGTRAIGHVATIAPLPGGARARAILAGDFTPPRRVELAFDEVILSDGRTIAIESRAAQGAENVVLRTADEPQRGALTKAREAVVQEAKQNVAIVTAPGKGERLTLALIRSLPYHPLLLARGTVYTARLMSAVDFGMATPAPRASADAKPAPESILRAHLVTTIGSAVSAPGARIEALLTRPILDANGSLILPEGTKLTGQVTAARPARRFHRHGQLRLLFEEVQAPDGTSEPLLASLRAVESAKGDRVKIDDEGGATSTSSNVRFAAPALAALSLVGATHGRLDYDTDGLGPEMQYGGPISGTAGGFVGLGVAGIGINAFSGRYVTVGITAFGLTRTAYSSIFGKGREISFPSGTSIEVQLAPGPGAQPKAAARQP
jgi:hypothetical protein